MERKAKVTRKTKETDIAISLNLDGTGESVMDVSSGMLGHLLTAFARHGLFDLEVKASGDLEVDSHHLTEDLGLVLGAALAEALGDKRGISRFGFASVPMDEALVECSVDISGRPYLHLKLPRLPRNKGFFEFSDLREFVKAFVAASGLTLHLVCRRGDNHHHIMESLFKCLGRALSAAVSREPRLEGRVPSTKGVL